MRLCGSPLRRPWRDAPRSSSPLENVRSAWAVPSSRSRTTAAPAGGIATAQADGSVFSTCRSPWCAVTERQVRSGSAAIWPGHRTVLLAPPMIGAQVYRIGIADAGSAGPVAGTDKRGGLAGPPPTWSATVVGATIVQTILRMGTHVGADIEVSAWHCAGRRGTSRHRTQMTRAGPRRRARSAEIAESRFDLDVGVLATAGAMSRLLVRNVLAPEFADGRSVPPRQARVGFCGIGGAGSAVRRSLSRSTPICTYTADGERRCIV